MRTTDPREADLFFVPLFASQGVSANFFCPRGQLELVVSTLAARSPYWRASAGRDHVFFLTGDKGACGLPPELATAPIFVSHFGFLSRYADMPRAAAERRSLHDPARVAAELRAADWCHAPHKDVVVPPLLPRSPLESKPPEPTRAWKHLLIHAGGVYGPAGVRQSRTGWRRSRYSQGVRQELYEAYPGCGSTACVSEHRLPEAAFTAAKLCLAPTGEGWGVRLGKSVLAGCVPLIGQPLVAQPFESTLDYPTFSRRLDHGDVPRLAALVGDEALPAATLHAMRRRLGAAGRALEWRHALGGLAYNLTVLSLCHRALELRGSLRANGASCAALGRALLPLVGVEPTADGFAERAAHGVLPPWFPPALANATEQLVRERRLARPRRHRATGHNPHDHASEASVRRTPRVRNMFDGRDSRRASS